MTSRMVLVTDGRLAWDTGFLIRSKPMPPSAPFDRPIALACSLASVRHRWLYVRCGCGQSSSHPVRLLLERRPEQAARSVADAVVRFRCDQCRGRQVTVHLCEDAYGPGPIVGAREPGWSVLLHGDAS